MQVSRLTLILSLAVTAQAAAAPPAGAQTDTLIMSFEHYEPKSTLVVPEHIVTSARYPFVDVHAHQNVPRMSDEQLDSLIAAMDAMNMAVMVNLSGGSGERLMETVERMKNRYPGRFAVFANIDFRGIDDPDFGRKAAAQLERDVANGAQGLKIFKNLGMYVTDSAGNRIATDDPRLDPIWEKCAELGIPVLIHTGDPAPFWEPHDRFNERWLELKQRPRRKRPPEPSWEQIMGEQWNVIRRHPRTTFISAHLSWLGNDLGRLGRLLDEMPNMYVEMGAVLAELGRQPRFAREWLIKYQDRVLFGKDAWEPSEYHVYFRTLETADEYFDYYRKRHAFWKLYGLALPDEVLRKIYYENALNIIPGLESSRFGELPSR
ncbi:MAG: amidohydrolase family protein [Gemmatimonadales bacterium]